MADNTQLNPGVGGAVLRTLQDASGKHWPAGLQAFTVVASDGANVLQLVDASHGLPVEIVGGSTGDVTQADENLLNATVYQGGAWVTQLAPGQTVGITGPVAISGTVPVSIAAPIALAPNTEIEIASGQTVGIDGPVAISGTVPVSLGSAVSLSPGTEVAIASGQTVGIAGPVAIAGTVPVSGSVSVSGPVGSDGSVLYDGSTALTPKFAKIDAAGSGDNVVVAAVSGKKIRVLSWGFTAGGAVSAKWRSGTTDITGARKLTEFASAGQSRSEFGHFETIAGQPLNLNLSAAVAVGGNLTYVLV